MDGKNIIDVVIESAKDLKFNKVTMHELEALELPEVKKLTHQEIKKSENEPKCHGKISQR